MTLTAAENKAHTIIRREFGTSANVMTPRILSYSLIAENVAVELSEGESKNRQPIFGVSVAVLRPNGTTFRVGSDKTSPIRSTVFGSRAAADAHVERMKAHLLTEKQPSGTFWRDIPGVPMAGLVAIDKLPTKEEFEKQYGELRKAIKPGFSKKNRPPLPTKGTS